MLASLLRSQGGQMSGFCPQWVYSACIGLVLKDFLEKDIPITTEQLLIGMDFHKNYRDIAMLLLAASYMLNILEANVSAHLLQFNVNDDISITPDLIFDQRQSGIRLAVKF